MKRKILSIVFVLSMLCAFMPVVSNAAASDITKLTSYIERRGELTNDKTGRVITYSFTEGGVEFIQEITYYPNNNTINFSSIWNQDTLLAGVDFTYNITTDTHNNPLGIVLVYSSSTSTTPSQTYGCVSYDFNMKKYTRNTTLTFRPLDSGVNQTIINTLNSQMNSLMLIGALGWDLICLDAGTTLNKIGFNSFDVGGSPTPTPTPTSVPIYTVSYDANGGVGVPPSQEAKSGSSIVISSKIPTRKGYNFLGWSISKTAQIADYTGGNLMEVTTNTTLYAVWEKISLPNTEGNDIIISNAQITGNTISFNVNLQAENDLHGTLLLAIYDTNGALVDTEQYPAEAEKNISFEKKNNYDSAKIFWWYDTESMYPMASSETLKLNEVQTHTDTFKD